MFRKKYSAPGGIRTHNLLIRSQALCPLSYGGTGAIIPEIPGHLPSPPIALTIGVTLVWKGWQHDRNQRIW